jgi:predicted neutral ceramidase superfamily lipid hydrolase
MLKPHIFLPFGVVLIAWMIFSKSKRLAIGAAAGMATSCSITYLMNPLEWTQYSQMVRSSGSAWEYIPCLSFLLRNWLTPHSIWLQFLPAALGCGWALAYFWRRRQAWDWLTHGSLLILVSMLVAPYTCIYDQGLVIPALLQAAFLTRSRNLLIALAFLSALVEIALYHFSSQAFALTQWTYWTAPAWLIWYLVASTPATKLAGAWSTLRTRSQLQ